MGKIKTTPQGKNIKAGQRATRGQAEMADAGSTVSSTGLDRAQFGAGSGAGDMADAIQNGNEQQLQALGQVGNQLKDVNGSLADLNSNMETLKKLEMGTLLFEFSKFKEFGDTFENISARDEKVKKSTDANFDELIARTEAGSRGIIKAITRLHGMISGDSAHELKQRLNNTSGSQNENLMRARNVREAQRDVLRKHEIYSVRADSPDHIREEFADKTRRQAEWSKERERQNIAYGQMVYDSKEIARKGQSQYDYHKNSKDPKKQAKAAGLKKKLDAYYAEMKAAKEHPQYGMFQIWDHGKDTQIQERKSSLMPKGKKGKFGYVKYNRDLNRDFGGGGAGGGAGSGGLDCCDDITTLLKDIELNTHVFREVREEIKKSYQGSLAKRETNLEATNKKNDKTVEGKTSKGESTALVKYKSKPGLGHTPYQENFAGSNMFPVIMPGGAKGKPGLIKRIVAMVSKYGIALMYFIGARFPFLLPLFSPIGAVVVAVGATLLYVYSDEIVKALDEADEYLKSQEELAAANAQSIKMTSKDPNTVSYTDKNGRVSWVNKSMLENAVDPSDGVYKPKIEFNNADWAALPGSSKKSGSIFKLTGAENVISGQTSGQSLLKNHEDLNYLRSIVDGSNGGAPVVVNDNKQIDQSSVITNTNIYGAGNAPTGNNIQRLIAK